MEKVVILLAVVAAAFALPKQVFEFQQADKPDPTVDRQHWAVLVAGSNGYFNYRHQADVCHAYQILIKQGFNPENIITMMYDDIAFNRENPEQGNIINKPNGTNVYEGVKIDYKGLEVNPETFISVLKGDAVNAGGKVLQSTKNDYVFVNFVDHGAPGILGFGDNFLKASVLNDAIMYMHENQKYAKMVFYVEACESGSIFLDLLPKDINVFATTAANAHESSYACYFDKTRRTYLGDVYSIKWMEDSDREDLATESLEKQFEITKEETNTSHVQEFGDMSMGKLPVDDFLGNLFNGPLESSVKSRSVNSRAGVHDACEDAVKSEDVPIEILKRSLDLETTKEGKDAVQAQLNKLMKEREVVDMTMKIMVGLATENHVQSTNMMKHRNTIKDWECYEEVVDFLIEYCPDHLGLPQNDYALRKMYMIVNMCENRIPRDFIKSSAMKACSIDI